MFETMRLTRKSLGPFLSNKQFSTTNKSEIGGNEARKIYPKPQFVLFLILFRYKFDFISAFFNEITIEFHLQSIIFFRSRSRIFIPKLRKESIFSKYFYEKIVILCFLHYLFFILSILFSVFHFFFKLAVIFWRNLYFHFTKNDSQKLKNGYGVCSFLTFRKVYTMFEALLKHQSLIIH